MVTLETTFAVVKSCLAQWEEGYNYGVVECDKMNGKVQFAFKMTIDVWRSKAEIDIVSGELLFR